MPAGNDIIKSMPQAIQDQTFPPGFFKLLCMMMLICYIEKHREYKHLGVKILIK